VFIERLWRTVKYEEIYPKEYWSVAELINSLKDYFKFYNNQRPHTSLNGNTPGEVYGNCTQGVNLLNNGSLRLPEVGLTH
jgi:putative transposase